MRPSVHILTIGDELLRGDIVDTNAAWLAMRCEQLGLRVGRITSVGDAFEPLVACFRQLLAGGSVVVATGGLGPTEDDRTAAALARAAGVELVLDEPTLAELQAHFARAGYPFTANNEKQAWFPRGATRLTNRQGTAPGFVLRAGQALVACMPGVPREMKVMFDEELAPLLDAELGPFTPARVRVVKVFGLGESQLDERLSGLLSHAEPCSLEVSLHYRTAFPENHVIVVIRAQPAGEEQEAADRLLAQLEGEIRARVGPLFVFGTDHVTLSEAVVGALRRAEATVALAESCTGGLLGDLLTQTAGSSQVFELGVVAYADAIKQRLLGVPASILQRDGAVSRACVEAMARSVRELAGATYGVAVSGIAGPGGGTPEKPVGTVHFALASPSEVICIERHLPFERQRNKLAAAYIALMLVLRSIEGTLPAHGDPLEGRWAPRAGGRETSS